ncbi:unnamed protein product, partial [Rotaria sp. Silwood2]
MATELNPSGSNPLFGVFFYGARTAVNVVAPMVTTAAAVKTKLDQQQYTVTQSNPSTLTLALDTVDSHCQSYCRSGVSRVIVIISSTPDSLAEARIRQLERNRGMTFIVVGVGVTGSTAALNRLASHPTRYYAVPVMSFFELILAASHISSVISDVPRLVDINSPLSIPSLVVNTYYTVQLNTYSFTTTNDTIIMVASNCPGCSVYGSLSEPNPISANTNQNSNRQNFFAASGYPNS